jgi:SAM-dependent methyltransferase
MMTVQRIRTEANWSEWGGKQFAEQFVLSPEQLDRHWLARMGVARTALVDRMLRETRLPLGAWVLEAGCNAGNQLVLLRELGFSNLSGIDVSQAAVARARERGLDRVGVGTARELPYGANSFDLVFTSGVLSHIGPDDVETAVRECVRVTSQWFWGCEYFALPDTYQAGAGAGYLWPADYAELFVLHGMKVVQRERLPGGEHIESFLCVKE